MADLDVFQQIYVQTFAAELMSVAVGPESILQPVFTLAVKAALKILNQKGKPEWTINWGPRLYKDGMMTSAGLDNAWYLSFAPQVTYLDGSAYDTYVLSIAGTAVVSKMDWLVEDFGVDQVVDFGAWIKSWHADSWTIPQPLPTTDLSTGGPFVALGTSTGVWNLLIQRRIRDGDNRDTVIKHLADIHPSEKTRLVVTGHSLGAALAPYLALGLKQSGLLHPLFEILVVPAAGATPGDEAFSKLYSKSFPTSRAGSKDYQVWNADFFNTLDIVPQAFQAEKGAERSLYNIPVIYGPPFVPSVARQVILAAAAGIGLAAMSGISYVALSGVAFSGPKVTSAPTSFALFMFHAIQQHVPAYTDRVGITKLVSQVYQELFKDGQVKKVNLVEATQRFPILRRSEAHRQLPEEAKVTYPYDDFFNVVDY